MPILDQLLNPIKTYWQIFVGVVVLGVLLYIAYALHHAGYLAGKAEVERQDAIVIAANEKLKLETEAQHDQEKIIIATAYSQQLDELNQRLLERGISDVPRGADLCVASEVHPANPVPQSPTTPGRVNETFALKPDPSLRISTTDALRDTLQCEKLQEWVTKVLSK